MSSIMQLSHKNHFKFGYNGKWFNRRISAFDNWMVNYGACDYLPLDFRKECEQAAKLIELRSNRLPWLFLSGGLDSEVMALSFLSANVPFLGVTLRFPNDINLHDIRYAKKFAKRHKINHKIIDFDIFDFFESDEIYSLAERTQCVSPQFLPLMKLMKLANDSGGFPVIGSGECYFKKEDGIWLLYEREKVASLYRFLLESQIEGCAGFFQYTPEQIKSYIDDPIMKKLLSGGYPYKPSNYSLKLEVYSNYFNLEKRPKFTGYEKLTEYDYKIRLKLTNSFPHSDAIAKTTHQSLEEVLTKDLKLKH